MTMNPILKAVFDNVDKWQAEQTDASDRKRYIFGCERCGTNADTTRDGEVLCADCAMEADTGRLNDAPKRRPLTARLTGKQLMFLFAHEALHYEKQINLLTKEK